MSLLTTYGYWAVFACIAIESTGIPFPGGALPGPLDDYRKAHRGERQSRLLAGQTPGRTERSHQRIGEEQPTVLVCETFDRVGQAFAQRRAAGQYAVPHGRSRENRLS